MLKKKSFARKTSTIPSRIWTYGIPFFTPEAEAVLLKQLRAGHVYRNRIVEILLAMKAAAEAIRETPEIAAAKATIEHLNTASQDVRKLIKSLRAKSRTKKVDTKNLSEQVKVLNQQAKAARLQLKNLRSQRKDNENIATAVKESNEKFYATIREERAKTPAFWGTYLLAEAAAKTAKKFKRWSAEGRIGVQTQKRLTVPNLHDHSFLQIDPVPAAAFDTSVGRGARSRLARTKARIRVDSTKKGRPIWLEFPLILHRDLPKDANIKGAWIQRKRIGTRWKHDLQIMMESSAFGGGPCHGKGTVAIDIGWRKKHDGSDLRIAYFCDDSGRHGEIRLPHDPPRVVHSRETMPPVPTGTTHLSPANLVRWRGWPAQDLNTLLGPPDDIIEGRRRYLLSRVLATEATDRFKAILAEETARRVARPEPERTIAARLNRVDTLHSTRDKNFDAVRATLKEYLKAAPTLPDWLKEGTEFLSSWKAQRRLVNLFHQWSKARFPGDEQIFPILRAWHRQDRHLYQWESNERSSTLGRRKDFYRVIANEFATRYATIVLEKFDLRKVTKRAKPEDSKPEAPQAARHNRHTSALSDFRLVFRSAVARQGGQVVLVPAAGTTMECHLCKYDVPWDAAPLVMHTCASCGKTWDQDENAARNMLARFASGDVVKETSDESPKEPSLPFSDGDEPDSHTFPEITAEM